MFVVTVAPFSSIKHWSVRNLDFLRLQLFVLTAAIFIIGWIYTKADIRVIFAAYGLLILSMVIQLAVMFPYVVNLHYFDRQKSTGGANSIRILSCNVYQFNDRHESFIRLVRKYDPDIILTMESNLHWEKALEVLETDYPNFRKAPRDNTYGMHIYTRLETERIDIHFLLTEERPTMEAHLRTRDRRPFVFWGVHPPPPSPTEKPDSRQKDAELMLIARKVRNTGKPIIAVGDFNTVCWSRVSGLFARTSGLIDARKWRGIFSTFPAKYLLLRFPLDLLFYSKGLELQSLSILENIGSDHLPVLCELAIPADMDPGTGSDSIEKEAVLKAREVIADSPVDPRHLVVSKEFAQAEQKD